MSVLGLIMSFSPQLRSAMHYVFNTAHYTLPTVYCTLYTLECTLKQYTSCYTTHTVQPIQYRNVVLHAGMSVIYCSLIQSVPRETVPCRPQIWGKRHDQSQHTHFGSNKGLTLLIFSSYIPCGTEEVSSDMKLK